MKTRFQRLISNSFTVALIVIFTCLFLNAEAKAAGVVLTSTPTSQTINAGQAANYTIKINRTAYADKVTLSALSLPAYSSAVFNPNQTTASSSALTITTATNTPAGTYSVKINGGANGITIDPIFVTLIVKPTPDVVLTATPDSQSVLAGQSVTYTIDLTRTNFDGAVSFSVLDLPDGVTGFFEPPTTTGNRVLLRVMPPFNFQCNAQFTVRAIAAGLNIKDLKLLLVSNCGINWAHQFGSATLDGDQGAGFTNSKSVIDTANGAYYLTGNTHGLIDPNGSFAGVTDVWVAKYDLSGNQLWIRQFGSEQQDRATEIKVDNAGNVYVAGFTNGVMGSSQFGDFDVWLIKFDKYGNRLWQGNGIIQIGDRFDDGVFGLELSFDANGNVTVTHLNARAQFRGNRIVTNTYNSSGTRTGGNTFSLPGNLTFVNEIALAKDGSVFVIGHEFNNRADAWIAKFTGSGTQVGQTQFIPVNFDDERPSRVTTDDAGNSYVSGCTSTTANTPDLPTCTGGASEDAWVAKFSSNVSQQWFKQIRTNAKDTVVDLTTDANGNLYLTGSTNGSFERANSNAGGVDVWFSRIDSSGTHQWVRQMGTIGTDAGTAISYHPSGQIIISGFSDSTFAGLTNGSFDILVMSYSANPATVPTITSITPMSGRVGDLITINGTNFSRPLLATVSPVYFNGIPAQVISINQTGTQMVVRLPQGATTGRVAVTNRYFCPVAISQMDFTVVP